MKWLRRVCWLSLGLVLLLGGFAIWHAMRERESPNFFVGTNSVPVKVQPSISVGYKFAAMVGPDGSLWLWGDHLSWSQPLGEHRGWRPRRLGEATDWKQVAAGFYGLVALKQDGTLWAMGVDTEGILALGSGTNYVSKPTQIGTENDWKEVRAGVGHCMALKEDGSLWAWGKNDYGQIGTGYTSPKEPIRRIGLETNWVAISPGAMSSFALRDDGTLWGWGGDIWMDGNNPVPTQMGTNKWKAISPGEYHIIALDMEGRPWVYGANASQLLANAPKGFTNWVQMEHATNWVEFVSGENSVIAKSAGAGWGRSGQQNYRTARPWKIPGRIDPLLVHTQRRSSYLLMKDGRLWSWEVRIGANEKEPLWEEIYGRLARLWGKKRKDPQPQVDNEPVLIWQFESR